MGLLFRIGKSAKCTNQGIRQGKRRNLCKTSQTLVRLQIVLKHTCLQQASKSSAFIILNMNIRAHLKIVETHNVLEFPNVETHGKNKNKLKAKGKCN